MIGILLSIVSWGYAAVDGVKRAVYSNDGYKRGLKRREDGTDITNSYFDWLGNRRDLDTGHPISVDFKVVESNGQDRLIKDLKTGKVIRNLSEEKRESNYRYAQTHNYSGNRTVCLYKQKYNDDDFASAFYEGDYRGGTTFKDLKTGEIYVARKFVYKWRYWKDKKQYFYIKDGNDYHRPGRNILFEATFYMDKNGYLVRESDTDRMKRKNGEPYIITEKEAKDFIKLFNQKQGTCGWYGTKYPKKDKFGNSQIESKTDICLRKSEYFCNSNAINRDI